MNTNVFTNTYNRNLDRYSKTKYIAINIIPTIPTVNPNLNKNINNSAIVLPILYF